MWWMLACRHAAPEPLPVLVGDAGRVEGEVVRLGVVGGWSATSEEVRRSVLDAELDGLLLLGDTTERGTRTSWSETLPTLGSLRVLPLPGHGERRSDRRLRTFHEVFEGYGVGGLGAATSWQSFTVETMGRRWRFVVLDTDAGALGSSYLDELSWLPKVLGGRDPVIVVAHEAAGSNARGYAPSPAMAELYEVLRRHVDPSRLALVISAAPHVAELTLPGGPWGEGWLSAWTGDPVPLRRAVGARRLAAGFDAALTRRFAAVDGELPELLDASVTTWAPPRHAVGGWWTLSLRGDALALDFFPAADGATTPSPEVRVEWTPDRGWR